MASFCDSLCHTYVTYLPLVGLPWFLLPSGPSSC